MTTTMSMRERREKIEQLVNQNPRVQTYANTFNEAKADLSQWHEHNDALCATNGALHELDELLIYSKAALDDLKHAKTTAYNQLMEQYPRVWDTTCADPFNTGTQDSTTDTTAAHDAWGNAIDEWADCIHTHRRLYEDQQREAGAEPDRTDVLPETEEMSEVPEPDTTATPIRGRVYRITAYNADQGGCHDVDPATLPDDFLDYLADAAHAAHAAQHGMPVDASQYIPVAVVKSILTKWETDYKGFRDFLAGRGLNPDGAGCAIFAIKQIRDDINKLATTEEAPNA